MLILFKLFCWTEIGRVFTHSFLGGHYYPETKRTHQDSNFKKHEIHKEERDREKKRKKEWKKENYRPMFLWE